MNAQSSAEFREPSGKMRRNPGLDRLLSTLLVYKRMQLD